jgi:hypothetical protein
MKISDTPETGEACGTVIFLSGSGAMKVLADTGAECDEGALAIYLSITSDEVRCIVDAPKSCRYATCRTDATRPTATPLMLTLRRRLAHRRANQTLERALVRFVGSALSPVEVQQLEDTLGFLRCASLTTLAAVEWRQQQLGSDAPPGDRVHDRGCLASALRGAPTDRHLDRDG